MDPIGSIASTRLPGRLTLHAGPSVRVGFRDAVQIW
jgi:hypothetical protein